MGHIVPSIEFIDDLLSEIEQGQSVVTAIEKVSKVQNSAFAMKIGLWLEYYRNSLESGVEFRSQYQSNLIEVLQAGMDGAPIHEHLNYLRKEMNAEFERQWKAYLEGLPMKLSLPLLLFFFPSYVVLLFGPLLIKFLQGVS